MNIMPNIARRFVHTDPVYKPGFARLGAGIVACLLGALVGLVAARLFSRTGAGSYAFGRDKALVVLLGAAVALAVYTIGTMIIGLRCAVEEVRAVNRPPAGADGP